MKKSMIWALMCLLAACGTEKNEETAPAGEQNMVKLSAEERKSMGLTIGDLGQQKIATTLKINGRLAILNQDKALITSLMGGVVKTLQKHLGEEVRAGEIIATVSHPDFINWQEEYLTLRTQTGGTDTTAALFNPQYIGLREEFLALQPKIEFAKLELKRQQDLNAGQAGSLKQLQQIDADLKGMLARQTSLEKQLAITGQHAQQNVAIKRAALEQKLRLLGIDPQQLSYGNLQSSLALRSPINGRISRLDATLGQSVDMNTPVAEVISSDKLSVELSVYEDQVHLFNVDKALTFSLLSNPQVQYKANVSHVGANLHATQKTALVQASILGDKLGLLEGMSVVAEVQSPEALHWVAPEMAIAQSEGKDYIFVLRSQTEAEWVFERVFVEKLMVAPPFVALRLPKDFSGTGLKIATNQAFFILGKMTNLGEE